MKSTAEFECDCKAKTTFDFPVPETAEPILYDVRCRGNRSLIGCDAVWTVKFRKHPDGQIGFTFRLKEPSAKLGDFLRKKKIAELTNIPQKKSPIWVMPGFKK